ncbi:TPA: hypothetical protein DIV55_07370 [Patescibacteria group bacterium]|nr:hypothetical protein [Patescibacteria group bacterium]
MPKESLVNTAFLISGGGTTMNAAIEAYKNGEIAGIRPVLVISSNKDAAGIEKANRWGIETRVCNRKMFAQEGRSREEQENLFSKALLELLNGSGVTHVLQAGWTIYTPDEVIAAYETEGKVIANQHPAEIDPGRGHDFGGIGMRGLAPHCARIAYFWMSGEPEPHTASTIHFAASGYDTGDLISVVEMPLRGFNFVIAPEDINREKYREELVQRSRESQQVLLPIEHQNVIAILKRFGSGETIVGYRREIPLVPVENYPILERARSLSRELFPKG